MITSFDSLGLQIMRFIFIHYSRYLISFHLKQPENCFFLCKAYEDTRNSDHGIHVTIQFRVQKLEMAKARQRRGHLRVSATLMIPVQMLF